MGSSVGAERSAGAVLGAWTCAAGSWDHLHDAGEKGEAGSGAGKAVMGLAMALGVSGTEQRESLVRWLWHEDLPGFRMVPQ